MNDPVLYAKKFEELIALAREATTGFEKTAVFAAAQALADAFSANEDEFDGYALEKVEQARWHICAAVGYDVTNGHDQQQHISWALDAASSLLDVLGKLK